MHDLAIYARPAAGHSGLRTSPYVMPPYLVPASAFCKEQLLAQAYSENLNGISHPTLTEPAYKRLADFLEGHGNVLSEGHRKALYALTGMMTEMAQGKLQGRWAFGLPTGMGKSSAVVAWVATL